MRRRGLLASPTVHETAELPNQGTSGWYIFIAYVDRLKGPETIENHVSQDRWHVLLAPLTFVENDPAL